MGKPSMARRLLLSQRNSAWRISVNAAIVTAMKHIPGCQGTSAVPEEGHHKSNGRDEMCGFKELVTQIPVEYQLVVNSRQLVGSIPEWTPRCTSQPGLEQQGYNTSPVLEGTAHPKFLHHVVIPNVPDNEGERVHQCQDEECI